MTASAAHHLLEVLVVRNVCLRHVNAGCIFFSKRFYSKQTFGKQSFNTVFSKWAESRFFVGDFEGQEGEETKGGDTGAKQHKGSENAQPLIDR